MIFFLVFIDSKWKIMYKLKMYILFKNTNIFVIIWESPKRINLETHSSWQSYKLFNI